MWYNCIRYDDSFVLGFNHRIQKPKGPRELPSFHDLQPTPAQQKLRPRDKSATNTYTASAPPLSCTHKQNVTLKRNVPSYQESPDRTSLPHSTVTRHAAQGGPLCPPTHQGVHPKAPAPLSAQPTQETHLQTRL